MKKRVLALCLCLMLPLSGCSAMLERGHESITAHVDYAVEEDDESILRAETYQGLVKSMLYFVNGHRSSGVIRLYNYTGDVEADLANARDEVMYEDPMGAFSVRALTYESTRVLTYYEIELRMTYSRTAKEMDSLREVTGLSGVRQELARLVTGQEDSAAFLASYFSGDEELLRQLLALACFSVPELVYHHRMDGVTVSLYPEKGTRRVIEIKLTQLTDEMVEMERETAREMEAAAAALLEANPSEGESYTVEELAAIVRGAHGGYDHYGSWEALGALTGEPVETSAALLAMEYLCRQCGIEVMPVFGEAGAEWLIVATAEGYRHLLAESLFPTEEQPDGETRDDPFRLYTDQELLELEAENYRYEWDMALYPACVDEAAQALGEEGSAEPS